MIPTTPLAGVDWMGTDNEDAGANTLSQADADPDRPRLQVLRLAGALQGQERFRSLKQELDCEADAASADTLRLDLMHVTAIGPQFALLLGVTALRRTFTDRSMEFLISPRDAQTEVVPYLALAALPGITWVAGPDGLLITVPGSWCWWRELVRTGATSQGGR